MSEMPVTPSDSPAPSNNRNTIIAVVAVIVLCCCCIIGSGLGYYIWTNY
ncbi:MAG: hypothetical protein AMXMBFR60_10560 [Chloroflexota bacterium]|nr:hypothetical protein [Anaerolineales bacterium]NUQ58024.1 hypothetical protein [Anaerolineales bacterium]